MRSSLGPVNTNPIDTCAVKTVFKAVTLSFLAAAGFYSLASGFAFLNIYLLGHWDPAIGPQNAALVPKPRVNLIRIHGE